jgi:hypothetical protein
VCRADNLTTFTCRLSTNLGASTFWKPQGLSRPVIGLLYKICRFVISDTLSFATLVGTDTFLSNLSSHTHSLCYSGQDTVIPHTRVSYCKRTHKISPVSNPLFFTGQDFHIEGLQPLHPPSPCSYRSVCFHLLSTAY